MGRGGEAFLLDMGDDWNPDLAEDLIRLSGWSPVGTSNRHGHPPGEKLSEQLWEQASPTDDYGYRAFLTKNLGPGDLPGTLRRLQQLATQGDAKAIIDLLQAAIPGGYQHARADIPRSHRCRRLPGGA
jgi:FlaA1/EpsC-like NDP-sugar epimerase